MNAFEKIMLALLATAATEAPIFVHSAKGVLIMNASEELLGNLLSAFAKPAAPAAPAVPPTAAA